MNSVTYIFFKLFKSRQIFKINIIGSKLAPFISGSFNFTWHCDWDCVNLEPISPRSKNSFEPP